MAYNGDLLITCKGTIGEMAFLNEDVVHIARQIMAIRAFNNMNMFYIKDVLETLISYLKASAKSMIPGISREDILSSLFPIPPFEEQHRIVAKVEEIFSVIEQFNI